jgi:hypothetical protein
MIRRFARKDFTVYLMIIIVIITAIPIADLSRTQASSVIQQIPLPVQVSENDPFHPTFAQRQYKNHLPQDFIDRALSQETRNAIAALSADERKRYMEELSQIILTQAQNSPKTIDPVGSQNIVNRRAGQLVPDVIPVAAINPNGQRVILTANYQEGKMPTGSASQIKKTSNLFRLPIQQGRGVTNHDRIADNFAKHTPFTVGDKASRSLISYNRGGVTSVPALQSGDNDFDGFNDSFENTVADLFSPYYAVSLGELGNFTFFADSPSLTPIGYNGQIPFTYFRVTPQGFLNDATGQQYGALRVDYLTLWDYDHGLVPSPGPCAPDLLGLSDFINIWAAHPIDAERSASLLLAPVSAPNTYNTDPNAYAGYAYYLAAHEYSPAGFDKSRVLYPQTPVPPNTHFVWFLSRYKHATYNFNPNFEPLVPFYILASTIAFIDFLLVNGQISELEWLIYTGLAYDTYFGCLSEKFTMPEVAYFPNPRINVGEVPNPINGSRFILDDSKFARNLKSKLLNPIPW